MNSSSVSTELLVDAKKLGGLWQKKKYSLSLPQLSNDLECVSLILQLLEKFRQRHVYDSKAWTDFSPFLNEAAAGIRADVDLLQSLDERFRQSPWPRSSKARQLLREKEISGFVSSLERQMTHLFVIISLCRPSTYKFRNPERPLADKTLEDLCVIKSLLFESVSVSRVELLAAANETQPGFLISEALLGSFVEPNGTETYSESSEIIEETGPAHLRRELCSAICEPPGQAFSRISASGNSRQHNGNVYNMTYNITYDIRLPDSDVDTLTQVIHRLHFPCGGSPTQEVVTTRVNDTSPQLDQARSSQYAFPVSESQTEEETSIDTAE